MKLRLAVIALLGQAAGDLRGTHSRTGCSGNDLEIRCPGGTEIKILQALYGRFDSDTCQNVLSSFEDITKCSLPPKESQRVVGDICDHKSSCSITVNPTTFRNIQDPCPRTSKYLNVKYECQTVDFDCPGVAFSSSPPMDTFTTYRKEGAWATDPLDNEGRVYFLPWDQSGATELKEFRNLEDLQRSDQATYYRLSENRADGTGFVVRDRKLYYNKRQSRELVKYDLNRRFTERSVELPDANYYDTSPYSIDKNTDIDLAVDEQGLWAIYATESNDGRMVISRLDPDSMEIIETFNTDFEKTLVMESWMTCGILYAIQADSENLLFMFDTSTGKHITGPLANEISLPNLPAETTSVKYDPRLRSLQVWALGRALTYQLRFQPHYLLYPTTTKMTTTTRKATTKSTFPITMFEPKNCQSSEIFGLTFPDTKFGSWATVSCHDGKRSAKWLCGGQAENPMWKDEPEMTQCTSNWLLEQETNVDQMIISGVTLSQDLLGELEINRDNLRPFDLYATLDLVQRIHEQNPRLSDQGSLEQNLLQVIEIVMAARDTSVWSQLSKSLEKQLDSDSVILIQQLLSRMSCKLRLNLKSFVFSGLNTAFQCWLEPAGTANHASEFPVELTYTKNVPASAYQSLIKFNNDKKMWLGSLHTDCDRPVSQWPIKYTFRTGGNCAEGNNGCRTESIANNGTICDCSGSSGPIYLAQTGHNGDFIEEELTLTPLKSFDAAETALRAILILSALLHAASGVSSLLLKEASLVDVDGLHTAHRAVNFLMMITLITVSGTYSHMDKGEMSCSVISVFLHWLCVSSFTWCIVRPAYLALLCAAPLRNLTSGWWLHLAASGLPLLITAAASATQMFPSHTNLCLAGPSMAFTWSAAGPAVILASLSMLLVLYAATRLRDNSDYQLHLHQIKSSLLWVGLLTVLLACEWGLILLLFSSDPAQGQTIAIFLAAIALFHAASNFICHCLCNMKAQRGCKSVLSAFGVREPEIKETEFFWSTAAAHNRADYEHTLRPVGKVPDCVQMTYTTNSDNSKGYSTDQSTMQLCHPNQFVPNPANFQQQHLIASDVTRPASFGTCPASRISHAVPTQNNSQHGSVYNPNHSIIQNPSLPRMTYSDFRPTDGEFEFHQSQYRQPNQYQQQNIHPQQQRPLLNQHPNGDVEV